MAPPRRAPKDMKERKAQDIKKALTHKARLKKSYFKLLEKEGQAVPEKRPSSSIERRTGEQADAGRPRLAYQDRMKINKERKLDAKKQALEHQKMKMKKIEEAKKLREQKKENFKKHTRTGQPAMGPRISSLLSKIKEKDL